MAARARRIAPVLLHALAHGLRAWRLRVFLEGGTTSAAGRRRADDVFEHPLAAQHGDVRARAR
jgi:hypothetical protein